MKRSFAAAWLMVGYLLCGSLGPATAQESPAVAGIEELRSRLNLTPEQEAQIAPYAEQRREKLEKIRNRTSSTTSRRDKRAALQEAKSAQDEFQRNVEPLLTKEQQAEWKKMREEARVQMKERLRNR